MSNLASPVRSTSAVSRRTTPKSGRQAASPAHSSTASPTDIRICSRARPLCPRRRARSTAFSWTIRQRGMSPSLRATMWMACKWTTLDPTPPAISPSRRRRATETTLTFLSTTSRPIRGESRNKNSSSHRTSNRRLSLVECRENLTSS